ncbi:MAG TPA: hypothetical protein VFP22_04715 [Candidatus Limnocylindrales bacterium]|nr:hypothetical protein [Candidatus Limnocylindrales bacterium]
MISSTEIAKTKYWLDHFRQIHRSSVPTVLHSHEVDGNGAPQWSPGFRAFLTGDAPLREGQKDTDQRRLRRALKRIRERSIREYEVLHRILELNHSIGEITDWLNERAKRGGHPERYTVASTVVIVFAAVDKLYEWY